MSIDQELQNDLANQIRKDYGILLRVPDLAHLYGTRDDKMRRFLMQSPEGRALRKLGEKRGREVRWLYLRVAHHLMRKPAQSEAAPKPNGRRK